jgi:hypothetical protein
MSLERAVFRFVSMLVLLAAAAAAPACNGKVGAADCREMLDRYIDMTLEANPQTRDLPPAQAAAAREMKKAVKKAEPAYAKVERQCEAEVTRGEYRCAMAAKNPDEWEACIE